MAKALDYEEIILNNPSIKRYRFFLNRVAGLSTILWILSIIMLISPPSKYLSHSIANSMWGYFLIASILMSGVRISMRRKLIFKVERVMRDKEKASVNKEDK